MLFIGLNMVGGGVYDKAEWKQRHGECQDWVRRNLSQFGNKVGSVAIFGHAKPAAIHQDFFDPLSEDARKFSKPMLYLHGDGHHWLQDRPFAAQNILRVQVDQTASRRPSKSR